VTTSALDRLQQKWTEYYRGNQALLREISRKQKVALDNVYADGSEAGKVDGALGWRVVRFEAPGLASAGVVAVVC
jgi:hypothetical protein